MDVDSIRQQQQQTMSGEPSLLCYVSSPNPLKYIHSKLPSKFGKLVDKRNLNTEGSSRSKIQKSHSHAQQPSKKSSAQLFFSCPDTMPENPLNSTNGFKKKIFQERFRRLIKRRKCPAPSIHVLPEINTPAATRPTNIYLTLNEQPYFQTIHKILHNKQTLSSEHIKQQIKSSSEQPSKVVTIDVLQPQPSLSQIKQKIVARPMDLKQTYLHLQRMKDRYSQVSKQRSLTVNKTSAAEANSMYVDFELKPWDNGDTTNIY